ncbi:DUF6541 family protein [Microbacterium sp. USHLN186]|uniref:DUF6541 family protein n=1 Tax=Microbacterium sp. USHLN186 TaxID=3081286 RepID=UPI0030185A95
MILDWITQLPVLLLFLGLVFVPGLLALLGVGMRGLALLAFAPVFTVAVTAAAALVFGATGVAWSPFTWAAAMLVVALVAFLFGRWDRGRLEPMTASRPGWVLPAALALGASLTTWRLLSYIQNPAGISQTNDAVFHLNAVRFILDSADASSLHVSGVIGGAGFYPSAWHAFVALGALISGAPIPVAVNMFTLVIGGFIWPLGVAWLTRCVTSSVPVTAMAAVLAGGLHTFPLLLFQWGVLYPNALSTALLPASIAAVTSLTNWRSEGHRAVSVLRGVLIVAVAGAALTLAQPSGLLPWMAITLLWVSARLISLHGALRRAWLIALLAAAWVGVGALWVVLSQGTTGSHWPPFRGKLQAFLDVLLNGQIRIPFAIAVSALMFIGLLEALRRSELRWFAAAWLGVSGLYVLVAAFDAPLVRDVILGAWYADPYRIAALAPVVVIPLAALGAFVVTRAAARVVHTSVQSPLVIGVALGVLTAMVLSISVFRSVAMPAVTQGTFDRESRYLAADDAYLNPDERQLLESLDGLVPAGSRVLGNPSTGTGFGYFLSGIDVYPRTWAVPRHPAWQVLALRLRDAATDPAVCEALAAYGHPDYVLDFGPGEQAPGRYTAPGMTDFSGQPGFELVESDGDPSLWRITACAQ